MPQTLIRPLISSDAAWIQDFASDARVSATCNIPHPYPENGGEVFVHRSIAAFQNKVRFPFAILSEGSFCGIITLNAPDFFRRTCEIDYWGAYPFWGKGIATEAVGLAVAYAKENFDFIVFYSACWAKNPASRRVLEKNGFTSLDPIINDGKYGQKLIGELIRPYSLELRE